MFTMKRIILIFKKNCWYQRISIGMDLLQDQIKLASWTCAVLFGFACAYDGGGGPGNKKINKYVLWILQRSLIFLAMIHFQSQSNILPFCCIATGEATWAKEATWLEGTVTNCWEFENWFGATIMNCWGWIWPGE